MKLIWLLLTGLALGVGSGALAYVVGDPQQFDPVFRAKYIVLRIWVVTHGVSSVIALGLGPWLFLTLPRFLHRALGRLYLLAVVVGALSGFPLALRAEGGWMAQLGFLLVDGLWLVCAWQALEAIRRGRVTLHRRWMVRSYALTFGAVLLRLYLYVLQQLGYDFNGLYPYTPWLSWWTAWVLAETILEGEHKLVTSKMCNFRNAHGPRPSGTLATNFPSP